MIETPGIASRSPIRRSHDTIRAEFAEALVQIVAVGTMATIPIFLGMRFGVSAGWLVPIAFAVGVPLAFVAEYIRRNRVTGPASTGRAK